MRLIDADRIAVRGIIAPIRKDIQDLIDAQPTVDAVPAVHAHWVDTGVPYNGKDCRYNYWECSGCHNQISARYGLHMYCPNCGAKMGEEEANENHD